jgi:hypothetical protein
MVDNPQLADLKSLRQRLGVESVTLEKLLQQAASDVGGKTGSPSWVGPAADRWHSDANGRHDGIRTEARRLLAEVDRAIAGCPEKVSVIDAKMYRMDKGS